MARNKEPVVEDSFSKINRVKPATNALFIVILTLFAVTTVLPVILVFSISITTPESLTANGFQLFPSEISFTSYQSLFKTGSQLLDSYKITVIVAVVSTFLGVMMMAMYAFVLAQKRFSCKKFYTFIPFFTMLFSGGLVPSYIINVNVLHLYDTIWILILTSLVSPFNIVVLRTFINSTIPEEMMDAAQIDGANEFTVFNRIVLPLGVAGLATIALFLFVGKWNEWFTAMLYIENPKLIPVQTMLERIQKKIDFIRNNSSYANTPDGMTLLKSMPTEQTRMAILIISIFPSLCAYPFFQKYFIHGLTVGSVKG